MFAAWFTALRAFFGDHRCTSGNLHATIYQVLGIDPTLQLLDPSGRPVPVLDDPTAISELL
jgi:hypothetical protein